MLSTETANHKKSLFFFSFSTEFTIQFNVLSEDIYNLIFFVFVKIQIIHRNMDHSHTCVGGVSLSIYIFCILICSYSLCFSIYTLLIDSTKSRIQMIDFKINKKGSIYPFEAINRLQRVILSGLFLAGISFSRDKGRYLIIYSLFLRQFLSIFS